MATKTYNIYSLSTTKYDFQTNVNAFVNTASLSPTFSSDAYQWVPSKNITAINFNTLPSVKINNMDLTGIVVDTNGNLIPGNSARIANAGDLLYKTTYTFNTPVNAGTVLKFVLNGQGLSPELILEIFNIEIVLQN